MIAYFILVHRFPVQFKRLFQAIYDPKNIYLIHVDKRSDQVIHEEVQNFLSEFPNTHILTSQGVVWGGYSMVEAELRGIQKLLELNQDWDYFINLSGQDFPIKSASAIKKFLRKNKGKDFIKISNQAEDRPNTMNRIENYFVESDTGFSGSPYERDYMLEVIPYIGGQWKIFSRKGCEFLCSSPLIERFRDYYKNTLIPDESFFQTVLMNTEYPGTIINDDKRAIVWIPEIGPALASKVFTESETMALIESGEIKLRPKTFTKEDFPYLIKSDALFGRKFDITIDSEIFDLLEASFYEDKL